MDNQTIVNELIQYIYHHIKENRQKWGITGSYVNEPLYKYSDIQFLTEIENMDFAKKLLTKANCHFLYSINDSYYFEKSGVVVILSLLENREESWIPLDVVTNKNDCYKSIVPYYQDVSLFSENCICQMNAIFHEVVKIVMSYQREDYLLINNCISLLKSKAIELLMYIEKNGFYIDECRCMPYVNADVYDNLLESFAHGICADRLSLDQIFFECTPFINLINVLIYQIEHVSECKIDVEGINNYLLSYGVNTENLFHATPDNIFSKYPKSLSVVYDSSRDDTELWLLLKETLYDLIHEKNVMELGVGTGMIAEKLIPLTKSYVGLEYSEHMLKIFEEKCRDHNYNQVSFILGDMMNIDTYDITGIDVFLERASLMFCLDPVNVIRKLQRYADEGALLIRIDFEEGLSLINEWLDIFDKAISTFDNRPIVLKEYDELQLVNTYLIQNGKTVEKRKLFSWESNIKITDFINNLSKKYLPYMQQYTDAAVTFGITKVQEHETYKNSPKDGIILIPKIAYAYISKL